MTLQFLTIHQWGAIRRIGGDIALAKLSFATFMADYGTVFRTFKHGMLHGFVTGLFIALAVIGTNALFERRSWKYTLINGRFWIDCSTITEGIICAWI